MASSAGGVLVAMVFQREGESKQKLPLPSFLPNPIINQPSMWVAVENFWRNQLQQNEELKKLPPHRGVSNSNMNLWLIGSVYDGHYSILRDLWN